MIRYIRSLFRFWATVYGPNPTRKQTAYGRAICDATPGLTFNAAYLPDDWRPDHAVGNGATAYAGKVVER